MTPIEWILAAGVVALFWVWSLYMMANDVERVKQECRETDDLIRRHIEDVEAAIARTYERQGIRRNR